MHPKIRKVLFLTFIFIFLVSGAIIIAYSLGWKINFDPQNGIIAFQRTGGISIKTTPKNVTIKIDDKIYPDQSGILQSETLIQNLLPKIYDIEISKDGYLPYFKNILVNPALVSKLPKIILIPKEIQTQNISPVKGNKISDISGNKAVIYDNSNRFYLYDLNNLSSVFNINAAVSETSSSTSASKIKTVSFVPSKDSYLLIESAGGLKIINTKTGELISIVKNQIVWTTNGLSLYYLKNSDEKSKTLSLYSTNLLMMPIANASLISNITEPAAKISKIKSLGDYIAFSDDNKNLYLFDQNKKTVVKTFENIDFFSFSPDGEKIALLTNDGSIKIYFLKDSDTNIFKKSGSISQFNLEEKEKILSFKWYKDSAHLFISFNQENSKKQFIKIKFMETDDRSNSNIYDIAENISDFYYDENTNIMYAINNGELEKIDFNNL